MNFPILIKQICENALLTAFPEFPTPLSPDLIEITEATKANFGHYQCNSAMKLAKLLNDNPRKIAEKLVTSLQSNLSSDLLSDLQTNHPQSHLQSKIQFSKVEIAGPGFINFTLDPAYLSLVINEQLHDPRAGVPIPEKPLQIIVEYSSPNIAKEMHVGHLRTTIIGDCLARVLRFLGHEVMGLNHLGDWGTQFGMLIAYIKSVQPEIVENNAPIQASITELVHWYKASKKRFDEDPEFKKQSQLEVVSLQGGNPLSRRLWEEICDISRIAFNEIYDLLDIHIIERGESFYNAEFPMVISDFEKKNLVTLSHGAKCVYLDGFTNREGEPLPLIIQKQDGGYNYATSDLASLKYRLQVDKAQWIIYVVDAGQSLHLQMCFEAAIKVGYYDPKLIRVDHVPFGLVLGPDGKKFKTRSGDTEKLIDLIQGAIQKAKTLLEERHKDDIPEDIDETAKVLGINAIKYADLSCHRLSDYMFSYDKMLKFEGNTAAFLLYAFVRIQSIHRKAGADVEDLKKNNTKIELLQPEEIALGLLVCQFSEILDDITHELLPSRLTDYLYVLAEKFHAFFHQCRVQGVPEQNSRLLLCEAVLQVMSIGIRLLGLKPLERM